jgi:hypothetical protein
MRKGKERGEIGRERRDTHILVLANEMRRSGHREWELQGDSLSSSDSSNEESEATPSRETTSEADVAELDKVVRWAFPFSPEMGQGGWLGISDEQGTPGVLLETANPLATMVPSDLDGDMTPEPLQSEVQEDAVYNLVRVQTDEPWFSTDVKEL